MNDNAISRLIYLLRKDYVEGHKVFSSHIIYAEEAAAELKQYKDKLTDIIDAAEIAYSEMAFTLHDILDPRRREDDDAWGNRRGKSLAKTADKLRAAIDNIQGRKNDSIAPQTVKYSPEQDHDDTNNSLKCVNSNLYDATPGCDGVIITGWNGIKCSECNGWHCF